MKNILKFLSNSPESKKELLAYESWGLRLAGLIIFFAGICMSYLLLKMFNAKIYDKVPSLFLLTLLFSISSFIFTFISYFYSKKILNAQTLKGLKALKIKFYKFILIIIGVPYFGITIWLYFEKEISSSIEMTLIFLGSFLLVYFIDWRKFIKSKERYETYFVG